MVSFAAGLVSSSMLKDATPTHTVIVEPAVAPAIPSPTAAS
jgi:hypothetical protein